jgi:hypothetical protein
MDVQYSSPDIIAIFFCQRLLNFIQLTPKIVSTMDKRKFASRQMPGMLNRAFAPLAVDF